MELIHEPIEESAEIKKELKKLARNRKIRKGLISIILVAAMLLVGVGAAWMAGANHSKSKIEEMEGEIQRLQKIIDEREDTPAVVNPVAPTISLEAINREIQEIGELATVEYLFTNAAKFSDSKQIKNWNIPLTEKSFTIKWDGVIKAGIRVDEITVSLDETEKILTVALPQAEILSYDTDETSIEVLDETDNKFNPITISDKVNFDAETEKEMKQRAIDNGILEKAHDSAEKIITSLLRANPAVGEDYTIEFVS